MDTYDNLQKDFIRIHEEFAINQGYSALAGRLMAILLMERTEITQKKLAELSKYSISSVSKALDELIKTHIVFRRKSGKRGSYIYYMTLNGFNRQTQWLKSLLEKAIMFKDELEALEKKICLKKNKQIKTEKKEKLEKFLEVINDSKKGTEIAIKMFKKSLT